MIIKNLDLYKDNGYMQGQCPGCREWEAPITEKELEHFNDEYAHHGSTERRVDKRATYYRQLWYECFQCPKCKKKFRVEYSNT